MEKEILIEDYNSNWTKEFEDEKVKLEDVLMDKVICIEHIGSTSVKGLGAKPIIDIAIGVMDLEAVNDCIEPLQKLRYEFVYHKEFPERRFFERENGEPVHITYISMSLKVNTGTIK